ncbi:unnamed protein product, partial [Closterium sp. NIES-54]
MVVEVEEVVGARGAAGAGGAGAAGAGGAGAADQSQPQLLLGSPLPAPAPHTEVIEFLTERREPETRLSTHVLACRVARPRPPAVLGTHGIALRPCSVPQRFVLPKPPASSLPHVPDPESDLARAASPPVTRLLATVVTDPDFESTAAFALVTKLVDFAARSRLDYVANLVTKSESVCPPSIRGEPALSSDVIEDRQFELECLAASLPRFASMLLCPEGDPDALDIPTPRSYAEAIAGEYSSQWQTAMDEEMASWKSTCTYVDEVPPPGANIDGGARRNQKNGANMVADLSDNNPKSNGGAEKKKERTAGQFFHIGEQGEQGDASAKVGAKLHPLDYWVLDSGAAWTMTPRKELLDDVRAAPINEVCSASGHALKVAGAGRAAFKGADGKPVMLHDVLLVPDLKANLISLRKLAKVGVSTSTDGARTYKGQLGNRVLWDLHESKVVYRSIWQLPALAWHGGGQAGEGSASQGECNAVGGVGVKVSARYGETDWATAHRRLGHVAMPLLKQLEKDGAVK